MSQPSNATLERPAWRAQAHHAPVLAIAGFAGSGLVAALILEPQLNVGVLLHLWAAFCCFAVLGMAVLPRRAMTPLFVLPAALLGQCVAVMLLYSRTIVVKLLPLGEMWLVTRGLVVVGALGLLLFRYRRTPAATPSEVSPWPSRSQLLIWLMWWLFAFLSAGPRLDLVYTPSSDPDIHAFFAQLATLQGGVPSTYAPFSNELVSYPSGFAVLNAAWCLWGGLNAVQSVNLQTAIQASLLVAGGVAVCQRLLVRGTVAATALLLSFAYFFLLLPSNGDFLFLEGTGRQSWKAIGLAPVLFAFLLDEDDDGPRPLAWLLTTVLLAVFAQIFAFVVNPSLFVVQTLVSLGLGLAYGRVLLRALTLRAAGLLAGASALLVGLLIAQDGWLRSKPAPMNNLTTTSEPATPGLLDLLHVEDFARRVGVTLWRSGGAAPLFPPGCVASGHCREYLAPIGNVIALILVLVTIALYLRRQRAALRRTLTAVLLTSVIAASFAGSFDSLIPTRPSFALHLLVPYTTKGATYLTAYLFLLQLALFIALLGWLLDREKAAETAPARSNLGLPAIAILVFAIGFRSTGLASRAATAFQKDFQEASRSSSLSAYGPSDVDFSIAAAQLIGRDEGTLLPGPLVQMGPEWWIFSQGTARAFALYSKRRPAFFHSMMGAEYGADNYYKRVKEAFDIAWLVEQKIPWAIESPSIGNKDNLYSWNYVRSHYYVEVMRLGDARLYRLRKNALELARNDAMLNMPIEIEPKDPVEGGAEVRFVIDSKSPSHIGGWACQVGSKTPLVAYGEFFAADGGRSAEAHVAGIAREEAVGKECLGNGRNGFQFAPLRIRAGTYKVNLWLLDSSGRRLKQILAGHEMTLAW